MHIIIRHYFALLRKERLHVLQLVMNLTVGTASAKEVRTPTPSFPAVSRAHHHLQCDTVNKALNCGDLLLCFSSIHRLSP